MSGKFHYYMLYNRHYYTAVVLYQVLKQIYTYNNEPQI